MSKYVKILTGALVCVGWLGSASAAEQATPAQAKSDESAGSAVNDSTPIYLSHGACVHPFAANGKKDDSTPTHWNHWSGNHYSGCHGSHGSHWNGW